MKKVKSVEIRMKAKLIDRGKEGWEIKMPLFKEGDKVEIEIGKRK